MLRITQHPVAGVARVCGREVDEAAVAEGRVRDDEGGDGREMEERDGGRGGRGGYTGGGDLVKDFGACLRACGLAREVWNWGKVVGDLR